MFTIELKSKGDMKTVSLDRDDKTPHRRLDRIVQDVPDSWRTSFWK